IIFLLMSSSFFLISAGGEAEYQIHLKKDLVEDLNNRSVVLSIFNPIRQIKNQVAAVNMLQNKLTNISYTFKQPDLYVLDIPGSPPLYLAIDEGQKIIEISIEKGKPVIIKGSLDSLKLLAYEEFRKKSNQRLIRPTYEAMTNASKLQNQEGEVAAVEAYVKASKLHRKELIDFTEREIGASIALFGTSLRWTGDDEVSRLDTLMTAFSKKHPNLPMTAAMKEKVARFKKVAIGARAVNLQGQTPDGADITLYQSLGKYTLIDFWASWCKPCLLQIPDLKKTYADFHSKGFEIFSYSLDDRDSMWKNALKKYDMPWKHASDIKGWQSEWATAYNVTFIPFNFLINEKGEIIAKNLHHKTLSKQLSQLFNTQ
ncbi:MAG: TlpA disulfide reductase family protein, partial [Candidatus Aminicenantaceae bacterium]